MCCEHHRKLLDLSIEKTREIVALEHRIEALEAALRLVRNQIDEDVSLNMPTELAAQRLILADINRALDAKNT